MATTSFRVALIIKGDRKRAEEELTKRMNEWFSEDNDLLIERGASYSSGSLLWWGIKDDETKEAE